MWACGGQSGVGIWWAGRARPHEGLLVWASGGQKAGYGHLVGRACAPSRGLASVGIWWAESWLWASGGQGVRALTRAG